MAATARTSSTRKRSTAKTAPALSAGRVRVVWVCLLASMTAVGGLLLLADGRPIRLDGRSLSMLTAASSPAMETIFRTRAPIAPGHWDSIVIHHSGSTFGSPATIEREHLARNLSGLGHHFIIGNGSGMEDGEIRIGYRWDEQRPGAHAAGPRGDHLNRHGISICLVGDGNRRPFSKAQFQQLVSLVESLRRELGIPAERVVLHADVAQVSDPGKLFPASQFRAAIGAGR